MYQRFERWLEAKGSASSLCDALPFLISNFKSGLSQFPCASTLHALPTLFTCGLLLLFLLIRRVL